MIVSTQMVWLPDGDLVFVPSCTATTASVRAIEAGGAVWGRGSDMRLPHRGA